MNGRPIVTSFILRHFCYVILYRTTLCTTLYMYFDRPSDLRLTDRSLIDRPSDRSSIDRPSDRSHPIDPSIDRLTDRASIDRPSDRSSIHPRLSINAFLSLQFCYTGVRDFDTVTSPFSVAFLFYTGGYDITMNVMS